MGQVVIAHEGLEGFLEAFLQAAPNLPSATPQRHAYLARQDQLEVPNALVQPGRPAQFPRGGFVDGLGGEEDQHLPLREPRVTIRALGILHPSQTTSQAGPHQGDRINAPTCTCCMEPLESQSHVSMVCGHHYCTGCLQRLFDLSFVDESL